ncbi:hypothetical protein hamaS1_01390 [Moorella sp. Hama-1]|nr:hypothetical protein hamaS1_01390 [Moorella sp. Hama-1]
MGYAVGLRGLPGPVRIDDAVDQFYCTCLFYLFSPPETGLYGLCRQARAGGYRWRATWFEALANLAKPIVSAR